MPDDWEFKSHTYDNCNCAVNCGCQFNLPSTYGYCQSAFVGDIVEGHFNDTPLAGLNWAGLYKWPGEIAEGKGRRQIVIDERADKAQRIAKLNKFSLHVLEVLKCLSLGVLLPGNVAKIEKPSLPWPSLELYEEHFAY